MKVVYEKKLKEERKKGNAEAQVLATPHDARGIHRCFLN